MRKSVQNRRKSPNKGKVSTQSRMDRGLAKAITRYRKASQIALKTTDAADEGPFIVADNVSKIAYERWSIAQEKKWQLFWNRITKQVWLYGDPSRLHEMASTYFPFMLGVNLNEDSAAYLTAEGSPALEIPAGIKEPDFAFGPRQADFPTVIGEVAYHNENFTKLLDEQGMWQAADYVQFFVGLKITDRTRAQKQDPKLTLITWRRDTNEYTSVEFGMNSNCQQKGDLLLKVPIDCLFHQTAIPEAFKNQEFIKFDLYDIRQRCQEKLQH